MQPEKNKEEELFSYNDYKNTQAEDDELLDLKPNDQL